MTNYYISSHAPQPLDEPQALFDIVRQDGVVIAQCYRLSDAQNIVNALNQAHSPLIRNYTTAQQGI